jgi:hypothetical protein
MFAVRPPLADVVRLFPSVILSTEHTHDANVLADKSCCPNRKRVQFLLPTVPQSSSQAAGYPKVDSQARNSSWTNDENIYSKLPFVSIYLAYDKRLLRFGTEYFHK